MSTTDASHNLELLDTSTDAGGCGCGGCGCGCGASAEADTGTGSPTSATPATTAATKETTMVNHTYSITGMTCGHCASAVTSELTALDGVTDVHVDLVAGGTSTVTVTSTQPMEDTQIAAALDEAGDYQLVK